MKRDLQKIHIYLKRDLRKKTCIDERNCTKETYIYEKRPSNETCIFEKRPTDLSELKRLSRDDECASFVVITSLVYLSSLL